MLKLNQALAREMQEKERAAEGWKWFTAGVRSLVMTGHRRTYEPVDVEGEPLAPEEKVVQDNWHDVMHSLMDYTVHHIDATAAKDFGNLLATADLKVDGEVMLAGVPVPHLLFLEKQVSMFRGAINSLPTRDRAKRWREVDGHLAETEPAKKNRTIKQQVPVQLAPPTKEHKAQVALAEKAVLVGTYETIDVTGAISEGLQEHFLRNCDRLLVAIRHAREEANTTEVEPVTVANKLFDFILTAP